SAGTTIISVTPTIAVGDSEWVKVTHTVPDTAQGGDADTGYLRAVITADPAVADTASFTTSVPENIAMLITPEALADTANTGTTVLYNFYVVNTGNMEDDYALWTSGAAWDVTIYDASMSVVIDSIENLAAGDSCLLVIAHAIPLAPPDSLVDMGYLGAVSLTSPSAIDSSSFTTTAVIWPPVRIVLAPDTTTLVIPPGGGSFDYTLAITNYGSEAYQLRLWNEILLPNGHELSLWGVDVNMAPASGRFRDMTQFVPAGAPPGIYGYTMYIADRASWQVWDSSGFNFEKLAGDEAARHNRGWALLGWEEELAAEIILPTHYDLHRNFPNPFNPTTMLIYDLPEAGNVLLSVYDLIGREVVKLVDGYRSAGTHQAFFDGDNLSSGVYFAVFKVNNFSKVQKMLLLK
ncbi:MAG TPA: T9SS type A sorting domain-containing protein, partial [bacterium]